MPAKKVKPFQRVRMPKEVKIGRNPKLSELVAWAEQNGLMVQIRLVETELLKDIVRVEKDANPSPAVTEEGQVGAE